MVTQVDIESLVDNPDNEYLFGMKEEDIEHTARGIKDNGFMGAINVYKMESGQYEIYSGHIRRYAAERVGMKKIPCLIEPMPDKETTKRRQLLGANLYGRNRITSSDPILVARQLEYHKRTLEMEDFKGDMREQLALEFGISGSQVYKYQCLLGLTGELQEMVSSGIVPYSAIYAVKSLNEKEQNEIAEKIKGVHGEQNTPLTREQVKQILVKEQEHAPIPGQISVEEYIEECGDCNLYHHNPEAGDMECYPETGDTVCCIPEGDEQDSNSKDLDKEKKSIQTKDTADVSDLERKVYKLESALSVASDINWTNKAEAKRIMQSLIALLTDQIGELE